MLPALIRPWAFAELTQNAGTTIERVVPGVYNLRPVVQKFSYTAGATAHTLTAMLPLNKTRLSAAAAAAAASVILTNDPGDYTKTLNNTLRGYTPSVANNLIATNDFVAIKKPDGLWSLHKITGATTNSDGTVTILLTVPTGGFLAGAEVHFFGITTDTNPNTGLAHQKFTLAASVETVQTGEELVTGAGLGDSIVIQSNNATNAGTLNRVQGGYTRP
jgi:hypothetical protein